MEKQQLKRIIEGALMAYDQPLTPERLQSLFLVEPESDDSGKKPAVFIPSKDEILAVLQDLQADAQGHGYELQHVSSGWRFQVCADTAPWVNRLWEEKPQRYSRALLETLSIIAYRQPITRGDIEEIRGVAVSSHIIKTLSEREWVKVVGHRDVPGRPSLYATTRQFLDYFNLASLEDLPSLRELADIDSLTPELDLQTDPTPEVNIDDKAPSAEVDKQSSADTNEGHESSVHQEESEHEPEAIDEPTEQFTEQQRITSESTQETL